MITATSRGESISPSPKSNFQLENRAKEAERRLAHISLLLSETEAENQRLNELSAVLKEEIRSYQRSEDRAKHIENLEYVKNVILKVMFMIILTIYGVKYGNGKNVQFFCRRLSTLHSL